MVVVTQGCLDRITWEHFLLTWDYGLHTFRRRLALVGSAEQQEF